MLLLTRVFPFCPQDDPANARGRYALLRRMIWQLSGVTALYARALERRALSALEGALAPSKKTVDRLHKYRRSNASMADAVSWSESPVPAEVLVAVNNMHVARSRVVMMADMVEGANKEAGGLDLDVSEALRATKDCMVTVLEQVLWNAFIHAQSHRCTDAAGCCLSSDAGCVA